MTSRAQAQKQPKAGPKTGTTTGREASLQPGTPAPADHTATLADALTATDEDATHQAMIDHEIMATSDAAPAGHLQSGDIQAPMPHTDDSDGATAHATTDAVAVPPPNLHRYDQAAYDSAARAPAGATTTTTTEAASPQMMASHSTEHPRQLTAPTSPSVTPSPSEGSKHFGAGLFTKIPEILAKK